MPAKLYWNTVTPLLKSILLQLMDREEFKQFRLAGGRKKDFWDLHELIEKYSPEQMIAFHRQRYSYNHDEKIIRSNFTNFSNADDDFEPICLMGKHWEIVKLDIIEYIVKKK